MTSFNRPLSQVSPSSRQPVLRRVLIVDDSRAQRKVLSVLMNRWGYHVTEADSGEDALRRCHITPFDIVISDWEMPGMSGLDFCRNFRNLPHEGYGYFILLTSKSEKEEVASGLDGGADDFLTKPVSADELRARLRAGERILGMQQQLVEKNQLIGATLQELQKLYDSLDRDLIEARKLQQTLVRERFRDFGRGTASLLLRPSGHVGGDLVGFFNISPDRVAVYSVDVSGHGVASAMMTARLAGLLSGASPDQNIALRASETGVKDAWPPECVAARFNRMMLEDLQVDQYFTMAYADINLLTGQVAVVQAGHPHPVILRADGEVESIGAGGLPIGLIADAAYERIDTYLGAGDRLFLLSDGVTECPDIAGFEFGEQGLAHFIRNFKHMESDAMLEALIWQLNIHSGGRDFPDDVSGVLFDYRG